MKRLTNWSFRPPKRIRLHEITRLGGRGGAALYEFALALPLLLPLVVGIIFGGITFYDYVTLADAVAAGARTLATNRTTTTPCAVALNVLASSASRLNQSSIKTSFAFAGSGKSCCPPAGSCSGNGVLVQGDAATLTATYPCYLKVPIIGIKTIDVCPKGDVLTSSTTVLIE